MKYGKLICNLGTILKERGISVKQICRDLHITGQELDACCGNQVRELDPDLICKVCFYLHISFEDLFDYQENDP